MLPSKAKFQNFEEYLSYDDGTNKYYELLHEELIELPPQSGTNVQIANRLFLIFAMLLGTDCVRGHGLELEVRGEPRNRYPDLTIIRKEHVQQLAKRNTIRLFMSPPLLVIEVVSPGEVQRDRDYIAKRIQYQDCRIPEYWIVDPETQAVLILELIDDDYQEFGSFSGDELVQSPQFQNLKLTATELFDQNDED